MGYAESLWRSLIVLRFATLAYAVGMIIISRHDYAHPAAALAAAVVMAGWTGLMTAANATERGRRWPVVLTDLAVSVALLLSTRYVETPEQIAGGALTVPTVWVVAAILACAIVGETWLGLAAGALMAAVSVLVRGELTQVTAYNAGLLVLAGAIVGRVAQLLRLAEVRTALAIERETAAAERERLARSIHDGVLQVLALVQRRGGATPDDELARLAGEQEAALRSMIATYRAAPASNGDADLCGLLSPQAAARVQVVTPGTPVELPAAMAGEVAAAVAAALDNVAKHAGASARAWVVVEDGSRALTVTVRDDGAGMAAGRLAAAEQDGRLGVARSIRGRVEELGGTLTVVSAPGEGTELTFTIPRSAHDRRPGRTGRRPARGGPGVGPAAHRR